MADASFPNKRARVGDGGVLGEAVFAGEEGALSHIAATKFFQHSLTIRLRGVGSFADVFREVASGGALYGVVPIENSSSGTLHKTYDLLVEHDVVIGGELGVREVYCLCAKMGSGGLSAVRRVLSHPTILEACSEFLETHLAAAAGGRIETLATISTTEAARCVARDGAGQASGSTGNGQLPGAAAAIATREAANRQGLVVLSEGIGNDAFLETRYILIHRREGPATSMPMPYPAEVVDPVRKCSACFAISNEPGAIFKLLAVWSLRDINILKVETRPLAPGSRAPAGLPANMVRLWDYLFYVDYVVPQNHTKEANARLMEALADFSHWQKFFGCYPSQITRVEKQAQSWEDMVDLMTKS